MVARLCEVCCGGGVTWCLALQIIFMGTVVVPFQTMSCAIVCLYVCSGPFACIALALWRIAQRDYGEGDAGNGNLMPALDIFYSLVLLQGGLYVIWMSWPLFDASEADALRAYREQLGLPDARWCHRYLDSYLSDMRARCWREPVSIRGRTLYIFAFDSLDSGQWNDMVSGVRIIVAFVLLGANVRPQFLRFRSRIQKLIDALGWRGRATMREPAARIVAHLAGDIRLAQFPGAMESISSLLQEEKETTGQDSNELILQGLAILEGLASDHHNCRVICGAPGDLVCKIMAPLTSAKLIYNLSNRDWADVVSGCFKVLHKIIKAPGKGSRMLRREICSNKQSISNLKSILEHGHEHDGLEELQMEAMGILTQLALDVSIDLAKETKETLIKKQLQIFLADGEEVEEEAAVVLNTLRECAGRTLLSLSTENTSLTIMIAQNDIISDLTRMLDAKNTMTCRSIAAQILENLCTHCDLDKQWVKETLLPKVLTEILSSKRGIPENGVSPSNHEESQHISAPRKNDEENQNISTQQGDMETQETSSSTEDQNKSSDGAGGNEEQTTTASLMQEAFLSLALVTRDKLVSADDFDDAVQKIGVGPGQFVARIKAIVEDNCQETAESLRIVKLSRRIVEPMMERDRYAQHFKNKEFVKSLSNASEIMSNLESCMLFAGTDFRRNKTMRPLLFDIEKRAISRLGLRNTAPVCC
ncbi:hypothetical protein HU200_057154 [Digitaria exilis]|uniref:Uncharacterized protein n=1 Tax=Digitaria exilis TaxID=1010633 RepID=A0A835E559_9POAL|nr:hypothetical protein HU200_057154 [Digitaria exilis]